MTYLLFVVVALAQEETAEELFRRIEKNVLNAETLKANFDWGRETRHLPDKECEARRSGSWGSFTFKGTGKFAIETWACSGRNEIQTMRISDGAKLSRYSVVHQPDGTKRNSRLEENLVRNSPEGIGKNVRVAFVRMGSVGVDWILSVAMESPEAKSPDVLELCRVSNFSKGIDSNGARYLKYRLTTKSPGGVKESHSVVQLWYEPKTYLPLKHARCSEDTFGKKDAILWFDEYKELLIGTSIPDENFKSQNN